MLSLIGFMQALAASGRTDAQLTDGEQEQLETLIAGQQDRWIPLEALRRAVRRYLPAAELKEMAGGHLLPEEDSEGVRRELQLRSMQPR